MQIFFAMKTVAESAAVTSGMARSRRLATKWLTIAWAAVFLSAGPALAATLTGEVVGIADGDTLTILDATNTQYKIRLAGIDAPEKKQAFGDRSTQNLAAIVFRKRVTVESSKHDRYGRAIGKVLLSGSDVNLMQVAAGLAWHYKDYASEQSENDRLLYAKAETNARQSRIGLWRDPSPMPPWDFRKAPRRH